jgi:hypothetical protein
MRRTKYSVLKEVLKYDKCGWSNTSKLLAQGRLMRNFSNFDFVFVSLENNFVFIIERKFYSLRSSLVLAALVSYSKSIVLIKFIKNILVSTTLNKTSIST